MSHQNEAYIVIILNGCQKTITWKEVSDIIKNIYSWRAISSVIMFSHLISISLRTEREKLVYFPKSAPYVTQA